MKKNKFVLVLGAALMLSGCGNATANISHGSDVIGTIGNTSITDGDIYGSLKSASGYSYALNVSEGLSRSDIAALVAEIQ